MRLTGFAVAGGRSRRMGHDKALLPWAAGDLLDHALSRIATVTDDVRILPGFERRYAERRLPIELDAAPDTGPLGGLLAALDSAAGAALLLAVDLPLVSPALLAHLIRVADGTDADAVVPVSPRGPEPLCAVYGAACRDSVRRRLAIGDLKMTGLWPDVRVRQLAPDEIAAFGDPDQLFLNVNTMEDYERALALA